MSNADAVATSWCIALSSRESMRAAEAFSKCLHRDAAEEADRP